jgi:D-glycero-alpha-D-manno-heptose-7-phosphate kinase
LDERLCLFYTGAPRQSGINNWEVFKQHINGDERVIHNFAEISRIAQGMHRALATQQWEQVAALMQDEWRLRRTNAPDITTPVIDKLMNVAMQNGGRAAKVCGAGGGGCFVVLVEPGFRPRVEAAVSEQGGQTLDFHVSNRGLTFPSITKPQAAKV